MNIWMTDFLAMTGIGLLFGVAYELIAWFSEKLNEKDQVNIEKIIKLEAATPIKKQRSIA
jgi:hypothetical protein